MGDAISLLSALVGLRSGGQAARGEAVTGFEALFLAGGEAASGGEVEAGVGAVALKNMYSLLTGLAKKAAYLGQEGDDASETLEEVAALSSDLAEALVDFDDETGLGLTRVLKAGLQDQDGVEISLSNDTAEAADGTEALVDPAAAVQALQSAIATVASVLRGISATATVRGQNLAALAVDPQVAARVEGEAGTVAAAGTTVATANAAVDTSSAAEAVATETVTATVETPPATEATTTAVTTAKAVGTGTGTGTDIAMEPEATDTTEFFLPLQSARSEDGGSPASRALLSRIVTAAEKASETSGATPATPVATLTAGLGAETTTRRSGPLEALITSEDIARAMAREGQQTRDVAAATQARSAETGTEPPRFAAALADQVRSAEVSEGRTRIELSPRGLGSIEVDVATRDDGTLQVVVRADNPAVLNSLRQERDLLAQALGGLDTGSLDLQSFSDTGGQESQRDQGAGLTAVTGDDAADATAEPAETQTATIGAGRLDIVT